MKPFPTEQDSITDELHEPDPRNEKVEIEQKEQNSRKTSKASTRKTIRAPGQASLRTAQACDRCRAKKSRCDGKQPACSTCAAAGMECVVSDRLSRKSYPKGYTELLEEQSRQLIAENARLKGALSMRDEQLASYTSMSGGLATSTAQLSRESNQHPSQLFPSSKAIRNPDLTHNSHIHEEGCLCCSETSTVHERPVSVAGSVYGGDFDEMSMQGSVYSDHDQEFEDLQSSGSEYEHGVRRDFGQYSTRNGMYESADFYNRKIRPAPGAFAAATAIEQMQIKRGIKGEEVREETKEQMLTSLVAASIPRSTEETLFIPTLLARICEAYGYDSTSAKLTATAIASLKDALNASAIFGGEKSGYAEILPLITNTSQLRLELPQAVNFLRHLCLPSKPEMDHLISVYFQGSGKVLPIINRNAFIKNYTRFSEIFQNGVSSKPAEYCYESIEKTGALIVLVASIALLSNKFAYINLENGAVTTEYSKTLAHFDLLIHEFIKPNCILTKACSLQSLQILALALQYCLATGDILTCYELRGRVISMAQQLRLHRCPAAVLGLSKEMNDPHLKAFMQGERRIVFWCVYVLDVYSSLNLGVPRLLKDYEIECAAPFSGENDDEIGEKNNENILIVNNTKLTIFGKVTRIALCLMQFSKVLGNIMDTIFSRSGNYNVHERALEKDQMLDCWRRDLPSDFRFETDMNGFSFGDSTKRNSEGPKKYISEDLRNHRHLLIFLYYHAKILIYLPIISKYGYHHNVGLSMKEKLSIGQSDISTNVSSMTIIQQSAIQILSLLNKCATSSPFLFPVPVNIPREHSRLAILVAKGSLDYIKGGPLHQQSKQLLLDTVPILRNETKLELPSSLTRRSASLLEYAVLSILGLNLDRASGQSSLRKRVIANESMSKFGRARKPILYGEPRNVEPTVGSNKVLDISMVDVPSFKSNFEPQLHPAQNSQVRNTISSSQNPYNQGFTGNEIPASSVSSVNSSPDNNVFIFENSGPSSILGQGTSLEAAFGSGETENDDELLKFDELMKNFGNDVLNSDFVTDGSLGLVPFLNEPNDFFMGENHQF